MKDTDGTHGTHATYDIDGFLAAYDKVMAKWPTPREAITVPTPFGTAYVNACGPQDCPPLVLLPGGGGATSASWYAQAADLAVDHRVYAVDLVGVPGRGTLAADRHPRTVADLNDWLDAVLDGLGIEQGERVDLGGHSYGGWIALHYALRAPARVRSLCLLDPTQCFAGFRASYLLHALPMLLRPTGGRVRGFLEWESGGVHLDPDWLRLQEAAAGFPSVSKPVTGPRPAPDGLRGLDMPVLLLLAGSSRTHDTYRVAARAGALLPRVETVVLPDVSHHALPQSAPAELGRRLTEFLRR
ncbi:alpha/beta fold hydrolase [Streptomyces pseudovenezuelae]|uniref:Pimeloyl-ACP methyl ester carboxylesterase n=1 Tax=Streptomyces pseudovenezuelae TaxID=67350 RepID=A0ABT6LJM7_9ACTN|nr:alpha/beta fold hydrolase [Streptomyces pseudovenezuelae]MDH6216516.1 pimeloyl-ACP methyl ester carboxylesterase [Streptomyces pseudovenezuelae]